MTDAERMTDLLETRKYLSGELADAGKFDLLEKTLSEALAEMNDARDRGGWYEVRIRWASERKFLVTGISAQLKDVIEKADTVCGFSSVLLEWVKVARKMLVELSYEHGKESGETGEKLTKTIEMSLKAISEFNEAKKKAGV